MSPMSTSAIRLVVCAFVIVLAPFVMAQQYKVTDLGNCGSLGYAFGINDSGAVVGYCTNGGLVQRPFLWTPAKGTQDIGTLGGDVANAYAINNAGRVVGYSALAEDTIYHAFLWTKATGMQDLGTLGGSNSSANGINNVGQVVGESGIAGNSNESDVFLWSQSAGMRDLGTLPGLSFCYGLAINDNGEVVGYCQALAGYSAQRAFLWTQATGMKDLGTLGGESSQARGINSSGEVVGLADTPDNVIHAFYWTQNGGMQEIVTPGTASQAFAVNDSGEVAGAFFPSQTAFVWTKAGGVKKISALLGNGSPYWVGDPYAINSSGQLAAYGTVSAACCDAFLVTPGK